MVWKVGSFHSSERVFFIHVWFEIELVAAALILTLDPRYLLRLLREAPITYGFVIKIYSSLWPNQKLFVAQYCGVDQRKGLAGNYLRNSFFVFQKLEQTTIHEHERYNFTDSLNIQCG